MVNCDLVHRDVHDGRMALQVRGVGLVLEVRLAHVGRVVAMRTDHATLLFDFLVGLENRWQ